MTAGMGAYAQEYTPSPGLPTSNVDIPIDEVWDALRQHGYRTLTKIDDHTVLVGLEDMPIDSNSLDAVLAATGARRSVAPWPVEHSTGGDPQHDWF